MPLALTICHTLADYYTKLINMHDTFCVAGKTSYESSS